MFSLLLKDLISDFYLKMTSLQPKLFMIIRPELTKIYRRRDRDGSVDGRLNMSYHRKSGPVDPADDAVTRRYVASRFQALSDEIQRIW